MENKTVTDDKEILNQGPAETEELTPSEEKIVADDSSELDDKEDNTSESIEFYKADAAKNLKEIDRKEVAMVSLHEKGKVKTNAIRTLTQELEEYRSLVKTLVKDSEKVIDLPVIDRTDLFKERYGDDFDPEANAEEITARLGKEAGDQYLNKWRFFDINAELDSVVEAVKRKNGTQESAKVAELEKKITEMQQSTEIGKPLAKPLIPSDGSSSDGKTSKGVSPWEMNDKEMNSAIEKARSKIT